MSYPRIAQFKTPADFRARLAELQLDIPVDDTVLSALDGSPLAKPYERDGRVIGNRWAIHPMEGWDAHRDGSPSDLTLERWRNFGRSGAKLIWGGEAAAVVPEGRANPRQTLATPSNRSGLQELLRAVRSEHQAQFGRTDDLLVGLQLTHSGRFCQPDEHGKKEPRIAYHHPILDARVGIEPTDHRAILSDDEIVRLIDNYLVSAKLAYEVGFDFVDVKACHGYLLHEFLSARSRPGPFGGDLAGRTRMLLTIIDRIHNEIRGLLVGVRLSIFDSLPFVQGAEVGVPAPTALPYWHGFGVNPDDPLRPDLVEPNELLSMLHRRGVWLVNLSAGSPYYNPHLQRPALFPPSDGYRPPEDPLVGVARQLDVCRQVKLANPDLCITGTSYTYLQDFLPHVAQALVRENGVDLVGLGRMVLSYPELPDDVLNGRFPQRKKICRTFSDCTTAPRNGLVSGCYPLAPFYKNRPEAAQLKSIKSKTGK